MKQNLLKKIKNIVKNRISEQLFAEKSNLLHVLSVTQSQIDNEDEIEITVNDKEIKIKIPNIAQEGRHLRLQGEGINGGDLYIKIKVIQ
jgi:DnaJ-class molecular chaperone